MWINLLGKMYNLNLIRDFHADVDTRNGRFEGDNVKYTRYYLILTYQDKNRTFIEYNDKESLFNDYNDMVSLCKEQTSRSCRLY